MFVVSASWLESADAAVADAALAFEVASDAAAEIASASA